MRVLVIAGIVSLAAPVWAEEPIKVGILPVIVHATEGHDYLRDGLADMLAARIGSAEGLAVVRADDPALATTDVARARANAAGLGVDYVVYGSFTRFGNGASLDIYTAALASADPNQPPGLKVFVQSGSFGAIIPELDNLAQKVARFAGGENPEGVDTATAATEDENSPAQEEPSAVAEGSEDPWAEGDADPWGEATGYDAGKDEANPGTGADDELADLRRRVEALERAVHIPAAPEASAEASTEQGGAPAVGDEFDSPPASLR